MDRKQRGTNGVHCEIMHTVIPIRHSPNIRDIPIHSHCNTDSVVNESWSAVLSLAKYNSDTRQIIWRTGDYGITLLTIEWLLFGEKCTATICISV